MLTNNDVVNFISQFNYDIRLTHNGRWIDQKCSADVLTVIADCILNFVNNNPMCDNIMTRDIWFSDFSKQTVKEVFKKPNTDEYLAKNEYDKFFQQPMELFASANILNKRKNGNKNIYSIANKNILEFIALREKNSLFFLKEYIKKHLKIVDYIIYLIIFLKNKPHKTT